MPKFVGKQDEQQRNGKNQSTEDTEIAVKKPHITVKNPVDIERAIGAETLHEREAKNGGGEKCKKEQEEVYEPAARQSERVGMRLKARPQFELRFPFILEGSALDPVGRSGFRHFWLVQSLQFLAGFEANCFAGRDRHFGACSRIASDSGFARSNVEDAKSSKLDAVPLPQGFLHGFKDSFNRHLRFRFGDTGPVYDFIDDV